MLSRSVTANRGTRAEATSFSLLESEPHQNVFIFEFPTIILQIIEEWSEPDPDPQNCSLLVLYSRVSRFWNYGITGK
jgi:hypothetical protein